MKRFSLLFLPLVAQADIDDLWITEVMPSTGQIEVTNVGSEAFTTPRSLPFCHGFNYRTSVPTNTVFQPGESRLYTVSFASQGASDLWLYRGGSFGVGTNIITGLQWGTTTPLGRAGVASGASRWSGETSSAPAPGAGESLQLTGDDPFDAASWSVGVPDLGNFGDPVVIPLPERPELTLDLSGTTLNLSWIGGEAPYQLQSNVGLEDEGWTNLGAVSTVTSATLETDGDRRFYRVLSGAELPQTASYRVTYSSLWSPLSFNVTPAQTTMSALIGATHTEEFSLWAPDQLASGGLEELAEDGSISALGIEVAGAIANQRADQLVTGTGIDDVLGTSSFVLTVDRDYPLLSLVSKLNDSPDWFTGIQGINLVNDDESFKESLELQLMPWDSGTDSGFAYSSPKVDTNPAELIRSLADEFIFAPSLLLGDFEGTLPVGGITIEKISD